ncbi:UNVERIFIED_CONTAM: hypothetical protein FKN15_042762 [Acipenser sinensis]
MRQEILWLEPHRGELPALKKKGEVRRPAPPATLSRQENGGPEPHGGEMLAMKKGGGEEVRRPAPPATLSRQENGWPEAHGGELLAMKKGGRSGPPPKFPWPEETACARSTRMLQLFGSAPLDLYNEQAVVLLDKTVDGREKTSTRT